MALQRGRKPKLSEELIVKAEKYVRQGNYDSVVCQLLNVSTQTWYQWIREGEAIAEGRETERKWTPYTQDLLVDFAYSIKTAQAEAEAEAVADIRNAGKDPKHWQARAWYLERKFKDRWGKEHHNPSSENENAMDAFLNGVDNIAEEALEEADE